MHDIHSHILPGVDDGAATINDSLNMLRAARAAGVTAITCTPHCRKPFWDYDAMWDGYDHLCDAAEAHGITMPLYMGFEVNHSQLIELDDWETWIDDLALQNGSGQFLLELSSRCTARHFEEYKRTIYAIQTNGYEVVIAHPERYAAIQNDLSIAEDLVRMGCKLQASADFIAGGRLGKEKKPAKRIMEAGLYSYIASDAHRPEHYRFLAKAIEKYGHLLRIAINRR